MQKIVHIKKYYSLCCCKARKAYEPAEVGTYSNHRQYFTFFKISTKNGADLVCGVPGQLKNIFEKILSQGHALRQPFSGRVRVGLT
jgi:hypothetical protein